ncbi:MAG: acetylglutamate kinase [Patescibacteria group bacterium]
MKEAIQKAEILMEAARYIQQFEGKIIVIKYGGNAMFGDEDGEDPVLQDIAMLSKLSLKIVVVHGGGPKIDQAMDSHGIKKKTVDGLRVTDGPTLQIVSEVLGEVNQQCVDGLEKNGVKAESFTEGIFNTEIEDDRLGYVGTVVGVNTDVLLDKIEAGIVPVISSLGKDSSGQATNINADTAASKLAIALNAEKLTILTNVDSVLDSNKQRVAHIGVDEVEDYIEAGTVHGGMIPKIRACAEAADHGVGKAHLINGTIYRALLIELFTDQGIGTEIVK